ncbi:g2270 [Coccomyxa elongata]
MIQAVLLALCFCVRLSYSITAPAISGPSTGTCGPITIRYGSSGSPDAKLQTFVAPAPLFIPSCNPASRDTYTYVLGVTQQSNYVLPGPVVRSIGQDYSPAFGYRGTASLDLTKAVANSKSSPLPVPAGFLDVSLVYTANKANAQCANASNTLTSAFLIQAPTATSISGPAMSTAGDPTFKLYVNVTYPAAAIQLPFSDPAAVRTGAVTVTNAAGTPLNGTTSVASSGPGFVTFAFTPSPPLIIGVYSFSAAYASSAQCLLGSSSTTPFAAVINAPVVIEATTVPPKTAAPAESTTPSPTTTKKPVTTTKTPPPSTRPPATTTKRVTTTPARTTKPPPTTTRPPPKTSTPKPTRRPFTAEASASMEADLARQVNTTVLADIALPIETAQDYAAPADAGSGSED